MPPSENSYLRFINGVSLAAELSAFCTFTRPALVFATHSNLEVNPGQTLALVGGNVQLNGGQLLASGGNVELGGMADTGTVGMSINGSYLGLSFPNGVERGDVSLGNGTDVNVLGGGGGSIAINPTFSR